MKFIGFKIPKELWDSFYEKYHKNSASRLRELITKDLELNVE
jgi:hypothetical protein